MLSELRPYEISCDSAKAAIDLWNTAKTDINSYVEKCSHRHRLKNMMLDDEVEFCFRQDTTQAIPILKGNTLIKAAH
mgnify:CR=1 FL=1